MIYEKAPLNVDAYLLAGDSMSRNLEWIHLNEPYMDSEILGHTLNRMNSFPFDSRVNLEFLMESFRETRLYRNPPRTYFLKSATNALEVAALAMEIRKDDEIIMPSFTYAATGNAFARQGAKLVFVDIEEDTLNIDPKEVEKAITKRTRAIIPIHYGGISADLHSLQRIARDSGALLLEDAAHCVDASFEGRALGTIGDLGCISFHHTKNITSGGSGGCLFVNNPNFLQGVDEIVHQGTDQSAFLKGTIPKYKWQRIGGDFEMTGYSMAYLAESLRKLGQVTERRLEIWNTYMAAFKPLEEKGYWRLARLPEYANNNGHIFYLLLPSEEIRNDLKSYLNEWKIEAFSHYEPLHDTNIGRTVGVARGSLSMTNEVRDRLLRLPVHFNLSQENQERVIESVLGFFKRKL